MDRTRLAFFVAIAFFAGAILAAVAFSEGSSVLPGGGARVLAVEVANIGTHDANVTIEVTRALGGGVVTWSIELPAGRAERFERREPPQEQLFVKASARWEAITDGGVGSHTKIAEPGDCRSDETFLVRFRIETTRGVSFPSTDARCD